ncbi:MAG: CHC2 zinc finger domain-containing protein, partial [Acetobacteraceae bacterium]
MQLPPPFLEELRSRTPLAELIGGRVRLSRSGRQWKGCCPFHDEKTPSFQVYDDHFHCYGCGAHGDAISFVMQRQGLGFMEAVTE